MSDECRFDRELGYCRTHVQFDPAGGGYKKGADPVLCTHAAAALVEAKAMAEALVISHEGHIATLQARVEEYTAKWHEEKQRRVASETEIASLKYLAGNDAASIGRLVARVRELEARDAEWARMLREQTEHGLALIKEMNNG